MKNTKNMTEPKRKLTTLQRIRARQLKKTADEANKRLENIQGR